MTRFPLHSAETAPEAAKPILNNVERGFGFVPNLIRVMAASPATADAYRRDHPCAEDGGMSLAGPAGGPWLGDDDLRSRQAPGGGRGDWPRRLALRL